MTHMPVELEYAGPQRSDWGVEYDVIIGVLGYGGLGVVTWIVLMLITGGVFEWKVAGACTAAALLLPLVVLVPLAVWRRSTGLMMTVLVTFGVAAVTAMAGFALLML